MKNIIDFLLALQANNNKEWFTEHKNEYLSAQKTFHALVEKLIEGIAAFDPDIRGIGVKDCVYRIYRDTRFSRIKTPYKTNFGAYICRGGKKSPYAGYYFHLEPKGEDYQWGSALFVGMYNPEPKILKSVREEIYENGELFEENIRKAKDFRINMENSLKKLPLGFQHSQYDRYLQLKCIDLEKFVDEDFLLHPDMLKKTLQAFESCKDIVHQLNRAVDYALEEDN